MVHFNPINLVKNAAGFVEGVATGNPVKTVSSTVKLCKSAVPFADFVPGLEEAIDGAIGEVMDACVEPVVDAVTGTGMDEIAHDIGRNAQAFYHNVHLDGIKDMIDSDDDGRPDVKGVLHTAAFAAGYPESAFDFEV